MNTTEKTPTASGVSPQQTSAGISRRHMVRAGLSAAPVLAVLKSNTVLAGARESNAVTTSAFASFQANQGRVSQARSTTNYEVRTPAQWKNNVPNQLKKKTFDECGFARNPGRKYGSKMTLEAALNDDDNGRVATLARYVVASYLTAQQFHDDRDVLALTTAQCQAIWEGQGNWIPFAGANWKYAQTMAYFETIYGIRG